MRPQVQLAGLQARAAPSTAFSLSTFYGDTGAGCKGGSAAIQDLRLPGNLARKLDPLE